MLKTVEHPHLYPTIKFFSGLTFLSVFVVCLEIISIPSDESDKELPEISALLLPSSKVIQFGFT